MAAFVADVRINGDRTRGEAVYRRASLSCMKCHAIGGAGGKVGPDMGSIGGSAQIDYLVQSLLDPNAKVKEGYHTVIVVTDRRKNFLRYQSSADGLPTNPSKCRRIRNGRCSEYD